MTTRPHTPELAPHTPAPQGADPLREAPMGHHRVEDTNTTLTSNTGVPVQNNQDSLKGGLRGPTLLEDFLLREKITQFDHERIPERVVHARGSAAHGYFQTYRSLADVTRASIFQDPAKKTPVFVRFSTVAGERGSTDLARDVRGFAVKFYTDEGVWDLVGNNMPVFFIQDAMKFPDLVHAVKPEPDRGFPQAQSAHDTFWDFVSLSPESTHMLLWLMSDRAIPRSLRMMQGFGVHTFRFVNDAGEGRLVKFHWRPLAGTHAVAWDEALKISGADPDFHRRDLWDAIESKDFPEWELGVQIFTEDMADGFSFDVLDATKLVPEELVPVTPIGRMVLDKNPDNFFAETEQVAFHTGHVVSGIDFTDDPLLQGRLFSYLDTQITRLGGPNFDEIPINRSRSPVHNHNRDGAHRTAIHQGRVAYEPNSLAGGCPMQSATRGFSSFPEGLRGLKARAKGALFADHYTQARLFWESQSPVERHHIVGAFRFELSKVDTVAVRARMLGNLAQVDATLAALVASGLGMTVPTSPYAPLTPQQPTQASPRAPEVLRSPSLSLFACPGEAGVRSRKVAILVADGVDAVVATSVRDALQAAGATVRIIGARLGPVTPQGAFELEVQGTLQGNPSVLFDAVFIPGGDVAIDALSADGRALDFVRDAYRHCKAIASVGAGDRLLTAARVLPTPSNGPDPALVVAADAVHLGDVVRAFSAAVAAHRNWARETDPPTV
ncbi:MAG: catalase [Polyangiales bacterium]